MRPEAPSSHAAHMWSCGSAPSDRKSSATRPTPSASLHALPAGRASDTFALCGARSQRVSLGWGQVFRRAKCHSVTALCADHSNGNLSSRLECLTRMQTPDQCEVGSHQASRCLYIPSLRCSAECQMGTYGAAVCAPGDAPALQLDRRPAKAPAALPELVYRAVPVTIEVCRHRQHQRPEHQQRLQKGAAIGGRGEG